MAAVKAVLADLPKVVDRIRTTDLCDRLGALEGFQCAQRYRNLKERQAGWLLRERLMSDAKRALEIAASIATLMMLSLAVADWALKFLE